MNQDIKRELQEALDDLLRQRRLREEAKARLTREISAEYNRRRQSISAAVLRAVVDARASKEWDTAGRTADYLWARQEVQTWGTLAVVELLTELRKDLADLRRDRHQRH